MSFLPEKGPKALAVEVLVAVAISGAGGLGARHLLASVNDPLPGVARVLDEHLDPAAPRREAAGKAVVVLIDGVGEGQLIPRVERGEMGPWGAVLKVDVETPSLSLPGYHALLTGVPKWASGVRSNAFVGAARADTIADRVREAGGRVGWALDGVQWFHDLAGRAGDGRLRGAEAHSAEGFARLFTESTLLVVHLTATDEQAHEHGTRGEPFQQALDAAIGQVNAMREAAARLPGGSRTWWFVGSDHGHRPQGGHGGPEPIVREAAWLVSGPGLVGGALTPRERLPLTALAPTIAAALGVAPPRGWYAAAAPLPLIEAPDEARQARRAALDRARHEIDKQTYRRGGLGAVGLIVAALGAAIGLARRGQLGALWPLVGALAMLFLAGPGPSISQVTTQGRYLTHTAAALIAGAALGWLVARRGQARAVVALILSLGPAAAALIVPRGSLGATGIADLGSIAPVIAGLVPAGVSLGIGLGKLLDLGIARLNPREAPGQPV
jgi:hypothetical protein